METKKKSKTRKDLHCPKRPAIFVARHYTSSTKQQVGNNNSEDKCAKALVKRMNYDTYKYRHRNLRRKRRRSALTSKVWRNGMVKASLLSVTKGIPSPQTTSNTSFERNFTEAVTNFPSEISGKLSGSVDIDQLCGILERAACPHYNPSDTRLQHCTTPSPRQKVRRSCMMYNPRRPSTAPNSASISIQSPRSRKTPIRGGLGIRRKNMSETVRIERHRHLKMLLLKLL